MSKPSLTLFDFRELLPRNSSVLERYAPHVEGEPNRLRRPRDVKVRQSDGRHLVTLVPANAGCESWSVRVVRWWWCQANYAAFSCEPGDRVDGTVGQTHTWTCLHVYMFVERGLSRNPPTHRSCVPPRFLSAGVAAGLVVVV